jgi:hypothetical protein
VEQDDRSAEQARSANSFRTALNSWMPAVVLFVLVVFIVSSVIGFIQTNSLNSAQLYPFVSLLALGLSFGVWFVSCFTSDVHEDNDDAEKTRRQGFRFAYVFALTTLVVLIFPVTNPWQPDILGPISLIRGCVDAQRDITVPASIRCGDDDVIGPPANGGKGEPQYGAVIPSSAGGPESRPASTLGSTGGGAAPTSDAKASDATAQHLHGHRQSNAEKKAAAAMKAKALQTRKRRLLQTQPRRTLQMEKRRRTRKRKQRQRVMQRPQALQRLL